MGSSLPPSSAHRLPAVSASEALKQIRESGSQTLPTGLQELDKLLVGSDLSSYGRGGVVRGQLIEIFGPPGSGKTAIGVQLAARVVSDGNEVVWIDCAQRLTRSRFNVDVCQNSPEKSLEHLHFHYTPTIAHLLALVHRPSQNFPPPRTHLIVIDDVSTLFPPQYVKKLQKLPATPKPLGFSMQQTLLGALNRIASSHNVAVVVLSHVSTRFRHSMRAFLIPAQDSKEWDDNFASRVGLFRDFAPGFAMTQSEEKNAREILARLRYAGIVKAHGLNSMDQESFKDIVPFGLAAAGNLVSVSFSSNQIPANVRSSPVNSRKRRFNEVPDTENDWSDSLDEYSWDEDDIQIVGVHRIEPDKAKKAKADSPKLDAAG